MECQWMMGLRVRSHGISNLLTLRIFSTEASKKFSSASSFPKSKPQNLERVELCQEHFNARVTSRKILGIEANFLNFPFWSILKLRKQNKNHD